MEIHLHPALIMKPMRVLKSVLDGIERDTGLVAIVSSDGATLEYPEAEEFERLPLKGLSMENALRIKNYYDKVAKSRNLGVEFDLEIF